MCSKLTGAGADANVMEAFEISCLVLYYSRTRLVRFHWDLCNLTVILKDCYNEVKYHLKDLTVI